MTPLRRYIARQLLLRKEKQTFKTHPAMFSEFADQEVFEIITPRSWQPDDEGAYLLADDLQFLPAKNVWIEHAWGRLREVPLALLLEGNASDIVDVFVIFVDGARHDGRYKLNAAKLENGSSYLRFDGDPFDACNSIGMEGILKWYLSTINEPRGNLRTVGEVHKGLARDLKKAGFISAARPLKPHTIITLLAPTPPSKVPPPAVPHLVSAKKRRHHVKAHLRTLRRGSSGQKTIKIPEHWRGELSLGIVRSKHRYLLPGSGAR